MSGPHAIEPSSSNGLQRCIVAQVAGAILGKQARVQNPNRDEVPRFKSWQARQPFTSSRPPRPIIAAGPSGQAAPLQATREQESANSVGR